MTFGLLVTTVFIAIPRFGAEARSLGWNDSADVRGHANERTCRLRRRPSPRGLHSFAMADAGLTPSGARGVQVRVFGPTGAAGDHATQGAGFALPAQTVRTLVATFRGH